MTAPTPGETAARDQLHARNSAQLHRVVAVIRQDLDRGVPRWSVEEQLHLDIHRSSPGALCALAMTALMRLADQPAPNTCRPPRLPRDHVVRHDVTDTSLNPGGE